MRIPPTTLLRLQNAFRRGDMLTVLADGDTVAGGLAAEPAEPGDDSIQRWIGETAMMLGIAHSAFERPAAAIDYLEFGVASTTVAIASVGDTRRTPGSSAPPATGATKTLSNLTTRFGRSRTPAPSAGAFGMTHPMPPADRGPFALGDPMHSVPRGPGATGLGVPPGRRAPRTARGTSLADSAELLLLDLYLHTGRYDDALSRITALLEPMRTPATRFAATRAQASIASLRGDDETAHFLLNTAVGLANRVPSRFRVALVEGDRAMILAGQGRLQEAVTIADRVLGPLVRPVVGDYQVWSNTEAAAIALTLSRASSDAGDLLTAQRLWQVGNQAAAPLGRAFFQAHLLLVKAVAMAATGTFGPAETALLDALVTFNTYGYRPAAAQVTLEQARLAHRRGLVRSARPLYERAIDEFVELGSPREVRRSTMLLAALDDGQPPTIAAAPPGARRFPATRP